MLSALCSIFNQTRPAAVVESGRITGVHSHQYLRTEIQSMPGPAMVPIREPKTHTILLADDLTLVREGLAALCQSRPQFTVVAQCSEGAAALRFIEERRPDLARNPDRCQPHDHCVTGCAGCAARTPDSSERSTKSCRQALPEALAVGSQTLPL